MEKTKKQRMWVGLGLLLGIILIAIWAYVCFKVLHKGLDWFVIAPFATVGAIIVGLFWMGTWGAAIIMGVVNIVIGTIWSLWYIENKVLFLFKKESILDWEQVGRKHHLSYADLDGW